MRTNRLRPSRSKPVPQPFQVVTHTSPIDKWLGRIANASQAGLLILAAFGYFYTVVPVYQKSLLDEEIAKKTLDLQKKESELTQKSSELASLTAAVSQMRGSLSHSQAEVGRLKGNLSEQYSELRYRLLEEFQLLGAKLCRIDKLPEGTFGACLIEKVLPTYNLKSMSSQDRDLLTKIVRASNSETSSGWQEFAKSIEQRREAYQRHKAEVAAKCEERRNTDDYKDKFKKIEIDYLCNKDQIALNSESTKIEIDALYSGDNFTRVRLSDIGKAFFGKQ